jgi:hypothetical protein
MTLQQLQRLTFASHCLVTFIGGLLVLRGLGPLWSLAVVTPLLALTPGIYRCILARLRLTSIVLVPYLTAAIMEAVANTELRVWSAVLMFGLLLELALLIALIRGVQHYPVSQDGTDKRYG